MRVKRGVDLRTWTLSEKVALATKTGSPIVFVNNACTIGHLVMPDDEDALLRIKLPGWLKGTNDYYLNKFLTRRLSRWL